ncbi:hypothetical protein HYS48_01955 [Candidatus Woesearchaeota archaeon]|nr:hypothetical protein [Candidatus Woesearchaeota archaeon]
MIRERYVAGGFYLFNNGFEDCALEHLCLPGRTVRDVYEQLRERFGGNIPEEVMARYPELEGKLLRTYGEGMRDPLAVNADDFTPEEKAAIRKLLIEQNDLIDRMLEKTETIVQVEIPIPIRATQKTEGA